MPYGNAREDSLPIVFHLTGEDAITKNAYWERRFALYYLDASGDEVLWDLTTMASGHAAIKSSFDSGVSILSLTTANGGVVFGPTGATAEEQFSIKLVVQDSDLTSIDDWNLGVWDVYVVDGSGRNLRLYQGDAAMNRNVTP